ncbi:MAG: hydroxymethylglutaryl-CoA reductase [Rickettsiales bacterium]|nr:hydroxymethylglutaryl-CoA reductase [Rickettsiales bacterium]
MLNDVESGTMIPTKIVKSIKVKGVYAEGDFSVPVATYETTLWPSIQRGANVTSDAGGINVSVLKDIMTRSVLLEADRVSTPASIETSLKEAIIDMQEVTKSTSAFCRLEKFDTKILGNLIFLRFTFNTGEASGHNMTTKASDSLIQWILKKHDGLRYISISGNYCVDKKNSAVNSIMGRGKYVVADVEINRDLCKKYLRSTPEKIVDINIKKNLLGSIVSGSVCSANAHFANILLGIYLSTGQDAANIVEGSQGVTHAEVKNGNLYFSVTLPNIIIGTVGNGKDLSFVKNNLEIMGCAEIANNSTTSRKLASIIAAAVLCGELSLLAAQTNQGELTKSHMYYERGTKNA